MHGPTWSKIQVGSLPVAHGLGGSGTPLLFLHGWGLAPGAYREPLRRLMAIGCTVAAPALPGFGGSGRLPKEECSFPGYARWAARYLQTLAIREPVTVVGHSLGGGVAVQLAHDHPDLVRALVLCNAVGGPEHTGAAGVRPMARRPLWDWGRHFGTDLLVSPDTPRVLPTVLESAVPNLIQHPLSAWRVGDFVRRADLLPQLRAVSGRGTPVTVVWSDRDRIATRAGSDALAAAAGAPGVTVPGHHNWLLAQPDTFADVVLRSLVDCGALGAALTGPAPA